MSNQVVEKKNIYFSSASRNASNTNPGDFTVNLALDLPLQGAGGYAFKAYLSQVVIPNDFVIVATEYSGNFTVSYPDGTPTSACHLPLGDIDDESLKQYFTDKISFDAYLQNGRWILEAQRQFAISIPNDGTSIVGRVLGFRTGVVLTSVLIENDFGELTGVGPDLYANAQPRYRLIGEFTPRYQPLLVQVRSSLVNNSYEVENRGDAISVSSILASIPNKSRIGETLVWSDPMGAGGTLLPSTAELNTVRFWLTDETGYPLNTISNWYGTLDIDKLRDDQAAITNLLRQQNAAAQETVRLHRVQVVQRQLEQRRKRSKFYMGQDKSDPKRRRIEDAV